MRDILVTLMVFGSLPFILRNAWVGVLVWSWLSYMNPHRLTWGFAYNMPFAQIVAVVLFLSLLFNREKMSFPKGGVFYVWVVFIVWMLISTAFAIYPHNATDALINVLKIQLVTFATLLLITDMKRINYLIWVIVVSIGFYSVKGGIFTILTGGAHRVWGPALSEISENNALALATLMVIPLMYYLYQVASTKWIKYGLGLAMLLSVASAIGSQSRGALLAIIAVAGFFWLKTKSKLVSGIAIILLAVIGFQFMPESWHERMQTLSNYEQDASAMGRIGAWAFSMNIASDRLTGGGFNSWTWDNYQIYNPEASTTVVAHSIYFSVLADHGWPGLVLFLSVLFLTWKNLSGVISSTNGKPEFNEHNLLARMLQVSMIAYMSGGAFLSLSYFDLPWHLIAIALLLKSQIEKRPLQGNSLAKLKRAEAA